MKYFQGVRVYGVPFFPFAHRRRAITIPGLGILCDPKLTDDVNLLRHEFGHVLQRRYFGWWFFWFRIAPVSLWSAIKSSINHADFKHADTWTEWSANRLSYAYFHHPHDWPERWFPRMARCDRKGSHFPTA